MTLVKICGLTRESDIDSAARAGADRIGLVLVPASPRAVSLVRAAELARHAHALGCEPWLVAAWSALTGPCVDGLEDLLEETPQIAAVQLHGRERPEDVEDFRAACPDVRVIKAHGVAVEDDLALLSLHAADGFLLDARPPPGAAREGGFGKAFDWSILSDFDPGKPWVLSGGLTPETVSRAIMISGAAEVDVSSGVESAPGIKDAAKVAAFIAAAKAAG